MNAYTDFAEVYDTFMDNLPYEEWAEVLDSLIRRWYGPASADEDPAGKRLYVVDLGCGTGVITRMMAEKGYDMLGVDLSEDMLAVAVRHSPEEEDGKSAGGAESGEGEDSEGENKGPAAPLYVCQDMRSLDLGGAADVFISAGDCVNYLLEDRDLKDMFEGVYRHLVPGGLYIFDFNTLHKYRDVIGEATIAESRENCAFIWENWFDEQTRINEYNVTIFAALADSDKEELSEGGGVFLRSTETHYQKGYTAQEMTAFAEEAGFEVLRVLDGEDHGPAKEESVRVRIVLRRRKDS